MRPKRTDDKYWIGTRDFNHLRYERDLEDYIFEVENKLEQSSTDQKVVTLNELENFYDQSAEDWHLWETPPYPTDRIFDALRKFIDSKK